MLSRMSIVQVGRIRPDYAQVWFILTMVECHIIPLAGHIFFAFDKFEQKKQD